MREMGSPYKFSKPIFAQMAVFIPETGFSKMSNLQESLMKVDLKDTRNADRDEHTHNN